MKFKEDWPEAQERLRATWEDRRTDRPCIAVVAPNKPCVPQPAPPGAEAKWLDPDWVTQDALASLQNTWWGGEAVPSYLFMGGWTVCLGGTPKFEMNTIWFENVAADFDQPSPFVHNPEDPWVRKFAALHLAAARAAGKDDFLVGHPCLLPASDLLSMHMGTEAFLLALVEHPDWMREAIEQGARDQARARGDLSQLIRPHHDFWYGIGGWMPFWAPERFACTQCDVSCMLSPRMFDEFIVPELEATAAATGPIWYHLDGGDARQHLPRLLSLPYLRVIQYTPAPCEPRNGPAHMDMYRRIQAAGRIAHIQIPKENVEPLVRELDPARLMLYTECSSPEEGRELLADAKRWMR